MQESARQKIHLDTSYHYPPELLELLIDAIPALFRSKQAVLDFFAGSGVSIQMLSDWRLKLTLI